jgi:bifunctional non-homologous end joining protein LigD
MAPTLEQLIATYADVENAMLVAAPPSTDYTFELKYDGYRIVACKSGSQVRLISRRGQDWTAEFPDVARAVAALDARALVLDGEVIAPDERGVPSFQRLQNRQPPFLYVTFDVLSLDGADLRGDPIEQRRTALARVVGTPTPPLAVSTALAGKADQLLMAACKAGFEGLVGKRVGSPYRPGRGLEWIKLKCQLRQEFAIVGYLPFTGSQRGVVGSLVLALQQNDQLVFAGKVGTGFDLRTRRQLGKLLEERHVEMPTARDVPRFGGLVRWAAPGPVVEVRFSEWTDGGHARHPSYVGLRPDKLPEDCVREGTANR